MTDSSYAEIKSWWSPFDAKVGDSVLYTLGPVRLFIEHLYEELVIRWTSSGQPEQSTVQLVRQVANPLGDENVHLQRCAIGQSGMTLKVHPHLPARPVVVRPAIPFWVHGHRSVDIFVSTPLSLRLMDATTMQHVLEVSTIQLPLTWFGPNPRDGEVCFASLTQARLDPLKLLIHPVRAITRVTIDNRHREPVRVERLKLPAPLLDLYTNQDHQIWTNAITLVRRESGQSAQLKLRKPAGLSTAKFEHLTSSHLDTQSNLIERALNRLIG
ncbi:MAG: hypothetical protein VX589_06730 [Myxococcota bacterium]|nr:hypothetical protein [Myxococcota bacterium]